MQPFVTLFKSRSNGRLLNEYITGALSIYSCILSYFSNLGIDCKHLTRMAVLHKGNDMKMICDFASFYILFLLLSSAYVSCQFKR